MTKIIPHFWYATEAVTAAEWYTSLFDNATITNQTVLYNTPSGEVELVRFELANQPFQAMSAGRHFRLNPSISLMVHCCDEAEVNAKWQALSEGGVALMPLGKYPFNEYFGWIQDRFGLSWQLMLGEPKPITPALLFTQTSCEAALRFYTEMFPNSMIHELSYVPGDATKVYYASATLFGQPFVAMDHQYAADFTFNEAFSFIMMCETQEEIDEYWTKLSAVPEAEACGWVKDEFGISWQIVPRQLGEWLGKATPEQRERLMNVMLSMKKLNIAQLMSVM